MQNHDYPIPLSEPERLKKVWAYQEALNQLYFHFTVDDTFTLRRHTQFTHKLTEEDKAAIKLLVDEWHYRYEEE